MKKPMKFVACVLCLSMLLMLLAACQNAESTASEATSETVEQSSAEQSSSETSEEPEETTTEEAIEETEAVQEEQTMYPLATGDESLTYFISFDSDWGEYVESWSVHPAFELAEEITGVHIEFKEVSASAYETQFNLMIVSGDYSDMIDGFESYYPSGIDNAIEEGIIIDLSDMLETYAPNYSNLMAQNEGMSKDTSTDSGAVGSLYNLTHGQSGPMVGAYTRQDWLDEQGLEVPETYEEYEEMLLIFKDAYDCSSGLYITNTGIPNDDWLATGYGVRLGGGTSGPWYQVDGVVKCGYLEDGFTDYLTMMNRWYEEGLISTDFVSVEDTMFAPDAAATIQEGDAAVWYSFARQDDSWALNSSDPDFEAVSIADAVLNEGDVIPFGNSDSIVDRAGTSISAECEDPQLALQWLDFWYSEEGILLSNYGVEGVSYELDENGEPQLTELITANPDGASQTAMMYAYTLQIPSFYDSSRTMSVDYGDRATWGSNRTDENDYPTSATLTSEEGSQYNAIFNDIQTYAEEMILKFIIGEEPLTGISQFQDEITAMGIATCIEIKQAAYDRYLNR